MAIFLAIGRIANYPAIGEIMRITHRMVIVLAALLIGMAATSVSAPSLRAADGDGLICKIHPKSKQCDQPAVEGCECINQDPEG